MKPAAMLLAAALAAGGAQSQTGGSPERELASARAQLEQARRQRQDLQQQKANLDRFRQVSQGLQDEHRAKRKPLQDAFDEYMTAFRLRYSPQEKQGTPEEAEMLRTEAERVSPDVRPPGLIGRVWSALSLSPDGGAYAERYYAAQARLEKARGEFWQWRDQLDARIQRDRELVIQQESGLAPIAARTPRNYDELVTAGPAVAATLQEIDRRLARLNQEISQRERNIETLEARSRSQSPAAVPPATPPTPQVGVAAILARLSAFARSQEGEETALAELREAAIVACVELTAQSITAAGALANAEGALGALRELVNEVQPKLAVCASAAGAQATLLSITSNLKYYEDSLSKGLEFARARAAACASESDLRMAQAMYDNCKGLATELYRQSEVAKKRRAELEQGLAEARVAVERLRGAPALRATVAREAARYQQLAGEYAPLLRQAQELKQQHDRRRAALRTNVTSLRVTLPETLPPEAAARVAELETRAGRIAELPACPAPALDPTGVARAARLVQDADTLLARANVATGCGDPIPELEASATYGLFLYGSAGDIPEKIAACRAKLHPAEPPTPSTPPPTGGTVGTRYGNPNAFSSRGGEDRPATSPAAPPTTPAPSGQTGGASTQSEQGVGLLGITTASGASPEDARERERVRQMLAGAQQSQGQQRLGAPPLEQFFGTPPGAPPPSGPDPLETRRQRDQQLLGLAAQMGQMAGQLAAQRQQQRPQMPAPNPQGPPGFQIPQGAKLPNWQGTAGIQNPPTPPPGWTPPQTPPPVSPPKPATPPVTPPPKPATPPVTPPPKPATPPRPASGGVDCELKYCPDCRSSIDILGQAAGIYCERCKQRYAQEIAACRGTTGPATRWTSGGKDYCVFEVRLGSGPNQTVRWEIGSCDQPRLDRKLYGPATQAACQGFVSAGRR